MTSTEAGSAPLLSARWIGAAWAPAAVGVWAAAVALSPGSTELALIAGPAVAGLVWWALLRPPRWLAVFFVCAVLTPPLPGAAGFHLAPLAAALGLLAGLVSAGRWRPVVQPLTWAFAIFLAVLLESVAFAALYSGWEIGAGSLERVVLFAIGLYVFLYSSAGPAQNTESDTRMVRLLFTLAAAGAAFACLDFYFQFPAPAGYSDQFVWLDDGVLRRAQGLFYEASTLGNFCAFFLVMIAVALFEKPERAPVSRKLLLCGAVPLTAALMFSYSRASVFNVAVAIGVLACLRFRRSLLWMLTAAAAAVVIVSFALPSFSANYWGRLLGSFSFFWQSPDAVLSGRLTHWRTLLDFLWQQPWYALLGVGYKTLPYSNFASAPIVADNTYLDLLVETGIAGLAAFLALNAAILGAGWRALRSPNPPAAFLGQWIFAFWCGQIVQMFSGDLVTYWRVLPVYFWVLGAAARQSVLGAEARQSRAE